MIGTISRWGSKGYGFVFADELSSEAWLHAKFLDNPEYQPRPGDRVEFEPERLPDGRYQARRVRLLSSPYRTRASEPSSRHSAAYTDHNGTSGFSVKLSLGGREGFWIEISTDAAPAVGTRVDSLMVHREIARDTDLVHVPTRDSLEELRLLRTREAPTRFRWTLRTGPKVAPVFKAKGLEPR